MRRNEKENKKKLIMFATETENNLSKEYLDNGYVIRPADDIESLEWIRNQFVQLIRYALPKKIDIEAENLLNNIHKYMSVLELNDFRLNLIQGINSIDGFREKYFKVARVYLEGLVGNELAMQRRVNLSIQIPGDDSSLLPLHADVWSGDSPFEVVLWVPV